MFSMGSPAWLLPYLLHSLQKPIIEKAEHQMLPAVYHPDKKGVNVYSQSQNKETRVQTLIKHSQGWMATTMSSFSSA
jgi:hypothetical protein